MNHQETHPDPGGGADLRHGLPMVAQWDPEALAADDYTVLMICILHIATDGAHGMGGEGVGRRRAWLNVAPDENSGTVQFTKEDCAWKIDLRLPPLPEMKARLQREIDKRKTDTRAAPRLRVPAQ